MRSIQVRASEPSLSVPPLTTSAYEGLATAFLEVMRRRNPGRIVTPVSDVVIPADGVLRRQRSLGRDLSRAA